MSALGGDIETPGESTRFFSYSATVEDAHVEPDDPSDGRRRQRPIEEFEVEEVSSHTVLLATVVAACVTVTSVLLFTPWAYATATGSTDLRSRNIDPVFEVRDKLVWLAAVVGAGSLGLLLAWIRRPAPRLLESRPVLALTVAGTVGVAISAAWSDPWIGLGPLNLVLAIILVPLLVFAVRRRLQGAMRFLWLAVGAIITALYVPTLWQTPQGMYDPDHAARNVDELLGPVAGNLPVSDYIPQYGGLLGLPLVPFRAFVVADVESWITAYVSLLSIITVGALCAAAALMLPTGRRALAPLLVIPVLLMKPSMPEQLLPAGLQRLLQTIPNGPCCLRSWRSSFSSPPRGRPPGAGGCWWAASPASLRSTTSSRARPPPSQPS